MKRTFTVLTLAAVAAILALPAGSHPPQQREISQLKRQVVALKAQVAKLRREKAALQAWGDRSWRRELALRRYAAARGPCPVTRPNGWAPPGSTFGSAFHGNGQLWVGLAPGNVVVDDQELSGAISQKIGWFRGTVGTLTITGRRIDGQAPPLTADVPDGYGDRDFQSSGLHFPAEGCWEVTGRVGDATLTFVTLVLAAG